jgi:hypothetical protein
MYGHYYLSRVMHISLLTTLMQQGMVLTMTTTGYVPGLIPMVTMALLVVPMEDVHGLRLSGL